MNPIRIAVLVLGVAAAGGALMLAMAPKPAPVVSQAAAPTLAPVPTDQVMVAARDLPLGKILTPADLSWQAWPKEAVAPFMIHRDDKAMADIAGSIVRAAFYPGEPIRRERLIKGANSGFLSAVLPSGKRAVAITIDMQGSTSAGGFVLPNDRVDVLRTVKASAAPGASETYVTETLLTNIRVLAIGQSVEDKNGQTVVTGSTATLELDPVQAETVVLAQRTGQLSLTLRSMLDAAQTGDPARVADGRTTVIRFGVEADGATH
ncbi:Flp pilus assembly protein CpaB [Lichenifustis flavocetrariae]|uniref:Flp pilus assembly protein CpaB n=1 Tax=Lichenifustis flavocetrariae TaxID=2949735 RepID=A0AA41YX69_9HYPH|nr:Flp pilus assembly protein CpaB [Lichenifustis flavocetrariae]MCW6506490.1 Flp pilus assembly protein CpaB [Lichenifustis flavocetrariae]